MPSDSSNKLEVHLREATLADVPAAARVLTSAFVDDPLSALLFPKRREFPDGYDQRYRAIARAGILSPESVCLIAEADVQDDQGNWQRDVAGFAYWIRKIGKKDMEGKDAEKIQRWKQGRDSWMKCMFASSEFS